MTPEERANNEINNILRAITQREDEDKWWYRGLYLRWGKIEKELQKIVKSAIREAEEAVVSKIADWVIDRIQLKCGAYWETVNFHMTKIADGIRNGDWQ